MPSSEKKAPIVLYTLSTPNGHRPGICLEELKAAYPDAGIEYEVREVDLWGWEHKEEWFIKINPNGKIPAIVHRKPDGTEFPVFESAAIILYLTQLYDVDYKLSFKPGSEDQSEVLQWMFFGHGGIAQMLPQASSFNRMRPKIPYAVDRFTNEMKRLYNVLELRLASNGGREYLAGPGKGQYTTADFAIWPSARNYAWVDIEEEDFTNDYPYVAAWIERVGARPAVQQGIAAV